MVSRLPMLALGMGAAVAAAFLGVPSGGGRWALHAVGTATAAGAVVLAVRLHRPVPAWPWQVMATGLGVLAVASGAGGLLTRGAGAVPDPFVAAVVLLGGTTIAIGVLGLLHHRTPAGHDGLVDAGIIAAAGIGLLWRYGAVPVLAASGAGPSRTAAVGMLVVLHAVTFAAGVRLLATRAWRSPSYWLLLASGTAFTAGSLPLVVGRDDLPSSWMPLCWLAAAALLAASALHPSMRALAEASQPTARLLGWRWVFLAGAAAAVPFAGLVSRLWDGTALNEIGSGAALVVVLLVVWRARSIVVARDRAAETAAALADHNAAVLASLMSVTAVLDGRGRVVEANDRWCDLHHTRPRSGLWAAVGESYPDALDVAASDGAPDAAPAAAAVRAVLTGARDEAELEVAAYLDGERRWFIMRVSPLAGSYGGVVVSHHDVTWRLQSEAEVRARADQQATVAWLGQQALVERDLDVLLDEVATMIAVTMSVECVSVLERLDGELVLRAGIGWSPGDVGVRTVPAGRGSLAGYALETSRPVVVDDLMTEQRFTPTDTMLAKGYRHGIAVTIAGHEDTWGVLTAHSGSERVFGSDDVHFFQAVANVLSGAIERDRRERDARHAALHDPLTGFANRELLLDRVARALERSTGDGMVAVLFCDIDGFKDVNSALGHAAGDELLVAAATRLSSRLGPGDTLARLSGDELVVVSEGLSEAVDARRLAARLRGAFDAPFVLRATERRVTASIGIALADGDEDPEALIRSADAAMRLAKRRGRGLQSEFDADLRVRLDRDRTLAEDLRGAVERGELSLVYQPVVSVDGGRIVAAEALLRWRHPVHGQVSPGLFIPIAEETGTIGEIGAWVLERTCEQVRRWSDLLADDRPFTVYVNLSAPQLAESDFVRRVAATLDAAAIPPERLGLEITESLLLQDADRAVRTLESLKAIGLTIAMDDFGTGFSSLSYLKLLPVDVVKVDRSFVDGLGRDAGDSAIVAAVVRMAAALDLRVTAEGVENAAQLEELRALGCDLAQGYYFDRPLPPSELGARLRDG